MAGIPPQDAPRQVMVLVDTSVWIDFLRGSKSPQRHTLHQMIEESLPVAVCGIILQEILQGVSTDADVRRITEHLALFPYLKIQEPKVFSSAAEIYRICRKRGKTIRKPVDCLIAAIAIQNQISLLHKDRDFDHIAKCTALKIFE
jgi:predicted nucleic acid-binding protein